jgi:hypothetical protein
MKLCIAVTYGEIGADGQAVTDVTLKLGMTSGGALPQARLHIQ